MERYLYFELDLYCLDHRSIFGFIGHYFPKHFVKFWLKLVYNASDTRCFLFLSLFDYHLKTKDLVIRQPSMWQNHFQKSWCTFIICKTVSNIFDLHDLFCFPLHLEIELPPVPYIIILLLLFISQLGAIPMYNKKVNYVITTNNRTKDSVPANVTN